MLLSKLPYRVQHPTKAYSLGSTLIIILLIPFVLTKRCKMLQGFFSIAGSKISSLTVLEMELLIKHCINSFLYSMNS